MAGATRYLVYAGDRIALTLTDEPGALISAHSPPPRPGELQTHPFVTASAHIPEREGELRRLLDESSSTADFLDRLRSAGYRVEQVE